MDPRDTYLTLGFASERDAERWLFTLDAEQKHLPFSIHRYILPPEPGKLTETETLKYEPPT